MGRYRKSYYKQIQVDMNRKNEFLWMALKYNYRNKYK